MTLLINNRMFTLRFRYGYEKKVVGVKLSGYLTQKLPRETTLTIEENGVLLVEVTAEVHPKDRFVRKIGRKVALARALKILGWAKADRATVWNAYRQIAAI